MCFPFATYKKNKTMVKSVRAASGFGVRGGGGGSAASGHGLEWQEGAERASPHLRRLEK